MCVTQQTLTAVHSLCYTADTEILTAVNIYVTQTTLTALQCSCHTAHTDIYQCLCYSAVTGYSSVYMLHS
jgi:hypothetical protein